MNLLRNFGRVHVSFSSKNYILVPSRFSATRFFSTPESSSIKKEEKPPIKWYLRIFGYGGLEHQSIITSKVLYKAIANHSNHDIWTSVGIEKDLSSWFRITLLHVWMMLIRFRADLRIRQHFVDHFFLDIEQKLTETSASTILISKTKKEWYQNYLGSLVAYDEGLVTNDQILASALFRNLFVFNAKASHLAAMVQYVRREMYTIFETNEETLKLGFKFGNPIIK